MRPIPNINIKLILNEITECDNLEKVIKLIIEYYLVNTRHRYSEVARYINEKSINDEQIIAFILANLEMIIDYCQNNLKILDKQINSVKIETEYETNNLDSSELVQKLHKLKDHIELELDRIEFSVKREREVRIRMVEDLNNTLRKAQDDMINTANNIEAKLNNTVISVLGIFSAIIIDFFGGLNVLGNIFTHVSNSSVSIYRLIFMSCLTGLIVFNTIFMLLHFISKILDRNMGKYCSYDIIDKFEESISLGKRLYYGTKIILKRHPMLFGFNALIILIMILTSLFSVILKLV